MDWNIRHAITAGDWFITASEISGLYHLEGADVVVVTDGAVHPEETVVDGSISLDYEASIVHIGLGYHGLIKTMNLEIGGGENGPAQSLRKNIEMIAVRFYITLGARLGTNLESMETVLFRSTAHKMNRPPPVFSGVKRLKYMDQWTDEKFVYVEQTSPLPCIVQSLDIFMDAANG